MNGLDHLKLGRYRFTLRLRDALALQESLGAVLRGGFGFALKEAVCAYAELPACDGCLLRYTCAYPALFEPSPPPHAEVLSNQSDVPLAFVIEPPEPQSSYTAGERFTFGLVLIGRTQSLPYVILAFQRLGWKGLGRTRARYQLEDVAFQHPITGEERLLLSDGVVLPLAQAPAISAADLFDLDTEAPSPLTLDFRTPTRLKYQGKFVHDAPAFHVVVRTLLRRVSSLSYFHGGQRWAIDYRGWIERANAVAIESAEARWQEWGRYSTRQKRHMNLGGIVGRVTYRGEVGPFLPLLRLGELIHVGKGTVFGNGRYRVEGVGGDREG